jgi:hypothetical protein
MARKPSMADAVPDRQPQIDPIIPSAKRPPSRVGRKGVAFWIPPDAAKQLRLIAAEEDRTTQSLMEEALNLLFQNRGKYRLASE